jgi:hypothetical protein
VDDHDFDAWIRDAREGGAPVLASGVTLFCFGLGWPFWSAALTLVLLGAVVLVTSAAAAFPVSDPGDPDY